MLKGDQLKLDDNDILFFVLSKETNYTFVYLNCPSLQPPIYVQPDDNGLLCLVKDMHLVNPLELYHTYDLYSETSFCDKTCTVIVSPDHVHM